MPVPVRRYVLVTLLGLGVLLAVVLLVRPFILSFAGARDDANYPLVAAAEADRGPIVREILLEQGHGLRGESEQDGRFLVTVAVAPLPGRTGYSVVNAWSPVNDCALELGADRLVDCAGAAWTYAGFPIDSAHPPLQAFSNEVRQGAIVVDFTSPGGPRPTD
jgi:hypothetical protein